MNLSFESDNDFQDLQRLQAAVEENDIAIPDEQTQSLRSTHNSQHSSSNIDTAIGLNILYDEKLKEYEKTLINRLLECRKRLQEVQNKDYMEISSRSKSNFSVLNFGKPYFKNRFGFSAPANEDTIMRANTGMYDFTTITSIQGWTVRDKSEFMKKIFKMSQNKKQNELESVLSQLLRDPKNDKKNEIIHTKKEIKDLKKMSLEDIVFPPNIDYDWGQIANSMNYRHKPQEYKALWNLFLHPSFNKGSWSKEEHRSLQKIASEKKYQNWDSIAIELNTNRTGYQCFVYFRTNMNNTFTSQKWTRDEEEYLKRLVEFYKEDDYIPWGKVTASMENRTKPQVYNKYIRLIEQRKGRFLPEEDAVILTCADRNGPDYKQMAKYLPGRSLSQCRVRYKILAKRRISATWTLDEDKKLLQLMANQDSPTIYSSLTKYFTGKDRINIRARYLILMKWMSRNPNIDLKNAPRRGARCLSHGNLSGNLSRAIENLKVRMQSELREKKNRIITLQSSEQKIEDAIIHHFVRENINSKLSEKQSSSTDEFNAEDKPYKKNINVKNVRQILVLLRAKLNKEKFLKSKLFKEYPGLIESDDDLYSVKFKSYSKKTKDANLPSTSSSTGIPDIWGNCNLDSLQYVMPPHLATITGCRKLLQYAQLTPSNKLNINELVKKNKILEKHMNMLLERFKILFLWPMLLSNKQPSDTNDSKYSAQEQPDKTALKRKIVYGTEDYALAMPSSSTLKSEIEINTVIDLQDSNETDASCSKDISMKYLF